MPNSNSDLYKIGQIVKSQLDLLATKIELGAFVTTTDEGTQQLTDLINANASDINDAEARLDALETEIDGGTFS
jgi:hypothetical protein